MSIWRVGESGVEENSRFSSCDIGKWEIRSDERKSQRAGGEGEQRRRIRKQQRTNTLAVH